MIPDIRAKNSLNTRGVVQNKTNKQKEIKGICTWVSMSQGGINKDPGGDLKFYTNFLN